MHAACGVAGVAGLRLMIRTDDRVAGLLKTRRSSTGRLRRERGSSVG
jgi:hypothetical protein